MPPGVEHGGGGSVSAGPSTDPCQLSPAISGQPSWVARPVPLAVSNPNYLDPSLVQHQVLGPAPSSGKKRRRSEVNRSDAQHTVTQVGFLNQHVLEIEPTLDEYPPYSWSYSPPPNSTTQHHAAVPANMVPGPSSLTHRGSLVSLLSEESSQLSSSSNCKMTWTVAPCPHLDIRHLVFRLTPRATFFLNRTPRRQLPNHSKRNGAPVNASAMIARKTQKQLKDFKFKDSQMTDTLSTSINYSSLLARGRCRRKIASV